MASAGDGAVEIFGVTLVGLSSTTLVKVLLTAVLVVVVMLLRELVLRLTRRALGGAVGDPRRFWTRQALQQVVTAFAAYFVILRGHTFGIGDRITLGGVRGDVVRLGFLKTTIMEMGAPASVEDSGSSWIGARQYTGRLVTVAHGVIFTDPVFNYSREFPYLWEEITLPVTYTDDRQQAEEILLRAAHAHSSDADPLAIAALESTRRQYALADVTLGPTVYWRLTDSWLELTLRFLVPQRGVREIKNQMNREILAGLDAAGIGIASAAYDIVSLPPITVRASGTGPETS